MLRLSKSKILDDYRVCPRKYYLKHFTNLSPYSTNEYAEMGSLLHELYEAYNLEDDNLEYYVELISDEPKLKTQYQNFLKIHQNIGTYKDIPEDLFNLKLNRPKEAERKIYNKEHDLVGVIDAVYETDLGLMVVDYKTGKPWKASQGMSKYRFELMVYVFLYQEFYGEQVDYMSIFFTQFPEETFIEKVSQKRVLNTIKKVDEIHEKIENLEFPRKESDRNCKFCDLVGICDEYTDDVIIKV